MPENIAAYTAPGASYPPYISVNWKGDEVTVTVRSPAKEDGSCGSDAIIELTATEAARIGLEMAYAVTQKAAS